jgi:hypothetical protein
VDDGAGTRGLERGRAPDPAEVYDATGVGGVVYLGDARTGRWITMCGTPARRGTTRIYRLSPMACHNRILKDSPFVRHREMPMVKCDHERLDGKPRSRCTIEG